MSLLHDVTYYNVLTIISGNTFYASLFYSCHLNFFNTNNQNYK